MIRFNSDYTEGAHPKILQRLIETNEAQTDGYGADEYCERARELIRDVCADPSVDVHFLAGGTQTNLTLITAALRPHQSVLSADSGHIFSHETGAIEAAGHKCETLPTESGKIRAADIAAKLENHHRDESFEHSVQPKLIYLSQPTEYGTLYSFSELTQIRKVCDQYGLILYVDGARLSYALTSSRNDINLATLTRLADAFYIGGTKAGLLFGEALILRNPLLKPDFRYIQKQHGGLLAKGRLLGVQFEALFSDRLFFEIGAHANSVAERIRTRLKEMGVRFLVDSPTNQLFPIFTDRMITELRKNFAVSYIQRINETESCIRICTHGRTKVADADALLSAIETLL